MEAQGGDLSILPGVPGAIYRTQSEKLPGADAEALCKQMLCTDDSAAQPGPGGHFGRDRQDFR